MNDALISAVFKYSWTHNLWGIAAIGLDGKVIAANPSFEELTGMSESSVIGVSEADFNHTLLVLQTVECRRIEIASDGLRALYYIQSNSSPNPVAELSAIAETLRESLASIYGFTELLLTQNYDGNIRNSLTATLLDQVETMSGLINEHLDVRNPVKKH